MSDVFFSDIIGKHIWHIKNSQYILEKLLCYIKLKKKIYRMWKWVDSFMIIN